MKKETFEKAKELEERIHHIERVIEHISRHEYSLTPPSRHTSYYISSFKDNCIPLNEGEVVLLRKAFEDEKLRLQQEFVML